MIRITLIFAFILTLAQNTQAQTKVIGKQEWAIKNLNSIVFRNGDTIIQAKTNEEWENALKNKQPAWCYYENNQVNGSKYGKLYNWYAVIDPRGLAPVGYHIPSETEWKELAIFLGGESIAGKKMKSTSGWKFGNGTNSSGFLGTPGGLRGFEGSFEYLGAFVVYFSTTENASGEIVCGGLGCDNDFLDISTSTSKEYGYYVRCLKD